MVSFQAQCHPWSDDAQETVVPENNAHSGAAPLWTWMTNCHVKKQSCSGSEMGMLWVTCRQHVVAQQLLEKTFSYTVQCIQPLFPTFVFPWDLIQYLVIRSFDTFTAGEIPYGQKDSYPGFDSLHVRVIYRTSRMHCLFRLAACSWFFEQYVQVLLISFSQNLNLKCQDTLKC